MDWLKRYGRRAVAPALFLCAACMAPATAEEEALFVETFEAAWRIIYESYYDPGFQGLNWKEVYEAHLPVVEAASDMESVRLVIRNMLGRLGQSHFALIPAEAPSAVSATPGTPLPPRSSAGLEVADDGNRFLILRVRPGSAAEEAGLRPGYELVGIDGRDLGAWRRAFATVDLPEGLRRYFLVREVEGRLHGREGQILELLIRDAKEREDVRRLELRASHAVWSGELANVPPQRLEMESGLQEGGVRWVRFNFFALELFESLRDEIRAARVEQAPGLVIDLRGNAGGMGTMAPLLAALLVEERMNLGTMRLRNGTIHYLAFPQPDPFTGKVAVLVDGRTASTGEILAAGLQSTGRARIFGRITAGAVLPSMIRELPNGDRLQYVVGDFQTPYGVRLEARGVIPDTILPLRREDLLAGRDTALEAALAWILEGESD